MTLEIEIAFYNELLPSLLHTSEAKTVVIKDRDFLGTFNTMDEAYEALLPRYGFVQYLIRPVRAREPVSDVRNLQLGVISVRP